MLLVGVTMGLHVLVRFAGVNVLVAETAEVGNYEFMLWVIL